MNELKDKVVIVTGAGRGIGRAIAIAFASEGAKVALAARTEEEIENLAREIRESGAEAVAIKTDMACEDDIKNLITETERSLGPVDILINNAAILELSPIAEMASDTWDRLMLVNLRSVFIACREVLPGMMKRRAGRIVNIGSMAGRRGYAEQGAYCASKHGLIGLSKVLSIETQSYDIRVHVLAPGGVLTDLSKDLRESRGGVKDDEWMTVEEVARAAMYLCTQDGAAFTDELTLRRYESEPWR